MTSLQICRSWIICSKFLRYFILSVIVTEVGLTAVKFISSGQLLRSAVAQIARTRLAVLTPSVCLSVRVSLRYRVCCISPQHRV